MPLTLKTTRLITACSILLMALAAGFSYGYVHTSLFIKSDATATLKLVRAQSGLFSAGLVNWCLILLLDLIVSWGVCALYSKKQPVIARITGSLRLLYTLVFGLAIAQLFEIPHHADLNNALDLYTAFEQFNRLWSFALIIFGLHLFTLAVPVRSASKFSRSVSVLLALAGLAYLVVHTLMYCDNWQALASSIEQAAAPIMALGELVFAVFLFFPRKSAG